MSDLKFTPDTVKLVFHLAQLGVAYLEKRKQKKLEDLTLGEVIDTVDEAIREFEELEIPEAFSVPSDSDDTEGSPV
jgi:DNA polymerase III epsilon subunit-like protein